MANDWWSQIGGVPTTEPPALPPLPDFARQGFNPQPPDPLATLKKLADQQQAAPQMGPLQLGSPNVPQMPMTGGAQQAQNNPVADMAKQYLIGYAFDKALNPQGGGGGGGVAAAPRSEDLSQGGGQPDTSEGARIGQGATTVTAPPGQQQPQPQSTASTAGLKDVPPGQAAAQPKSKAEWQGFAKSVATQAGLDPDIFVRQIDQESGFNPDARGGSGEIGIAQFMPATAAGLGIDPADPQAALAGAAHLVAYYKKKYGSIQNALIAYNAGEGALQAYLNGAPLNETTKGYLRAILGSS